MTPTWMVPAFDEDKDFSARSRMSAKPLSIESLAFEHGEKAFIQRVIITGPNQPHQGAYSSLGSTMPEGKQRILRSLVRTMHHLARTTLPAGHLERIEYQLVCRLFAMHQPTTQRLKASRTSVKYRNTAALGT
jgi:hypothetical protein